MRKNAQINAHLWRPVPAKHSKTTPGNLSLLLFQTVSARQGPCPGQVFSYSNRTKNPIPVLAIPGSFMEFPGSLHPLQVEERDCEQFLQFVNECKVLKVK